MFGISARLGWEKGMWNVEDVLRDGCSCRYRWELRNAMVKQNEAEEVNGRMAGVKMMS